MTKNQKIFKKILKICNEFRVKYSSLAKIFLLKFSLKLLRDVDNFHLFLLKINFSLELFAKHIKTRYSRYFFEILSLF